MKRFVLILECDQHTATRKIEAALEFSTAREALAEALNCGVSIRLAPINLKPLEPEPKGGT